MPPTKQPMLPGPPPRPDRSVRNHFAFLQCRPGFDSRVSCFQNLFGGAGALGIAAPL